jgi:broad specificity phosphatase PhoE
MIRILLLRHEERNMLDPRFFTSLTEKGLQKANDLKDTLEKYDKKYKIDAIYSSPFLRTMQTIYPYAQSEKKRVNMEYGLYEYLHNPLLHTHDWYVEPEELLEKYPQFDKIVERHYISVMKKDDFTLFENEIDLERRIVKMMNMLISHHIGQTILIVSHQATINKIKDLYIEPTSLRTHYPMGHVEMYELKFSG